MTPDECKQLVSTINDRVTQLLEPYGIAVSYTTGAGRNIAEFAFRIPASTPADKSQPGKWSELVLYLDAHELQHYVTNAECLDKLPRTWADVIAGYAPELFESAPLPTAAEVDWRPTEMMPEDFGAA
ncbi:hypothetical protein GobsT_05550 [Gemmata obscuriglobus]|uniref:Uncharacterized protein n=1 Tax=Gemmata obscuriglobus TaxID=114 RepID=A0A2Z3HD47_9BACT|nr:hypothetical protein [Gemmata obscuriglobus]AWM40885.1 hypothetical protein C1280_30435 [Gemmata obscuriglobus]QEG25820.1 hypothetical protein GobsT_05550 [Gemmata obscuriglobus]VTR99739.1 unnamed protein product [Gemmata obscuriglobus UQM 2246]